MPNNSTCKYPMPHDFHHCNYCDGTYGTKRRDWIWNYVLSILMHKLLPPWCLVNWSECSECSRGRVVYIATVMYWHKSDCNDFNVVSSPVEMRYGI